MQQQATVACVALVPVRTPVFGLETQFDVAEDAPTTRADQDCVTEVRSRAAPGRPW
jgi:hypothetical protein